MEKRGRVHAHTAQRGLERQREQDAPNARGTDVRAPGTPSSCATSLLVLQGCTAGCRDDTAQIRKGPARHRQGFSWVLQIRGHELQYTEQQLGRS